VNDRTRAGTFAIRIKGARLIALSASRFGNDLFKQRVDIRKRLF
jgi:hypothetical protein